MQVVGLSIILAFVLIFRNNLALTTSAFFSSFGSEDVRVNKDAARPEGSDGAGAAGDDTRPQPSESSTSER